MIKLANIILLNIIYLFIYGDIMRTILHVDIDAFYASVEEIDDPSIKGKPVVVGGKSDHGIVTTANYEARKYNIHSAMPMFMAKNLCDNLIIKPMRRPRYLEKSKEKNLKRFLIF